MGAALVAAVAAGLAGCSQTVTGEARSAGGNSDVAPTTAGGETTDATSPGQSTTSRTTSAAEATETSPFDLEVGDCIEEDLAEGSISSVGLVPCEQEHYYEVFALRMLPGSTFPGEEEVSEQADSECAEAFEVFVGMSYAESELYLNPLYPTAGSWEDGDREVVCLIYDPDGPVTGTLEGAGR